MYKKYPKCILEKIKSNTFYPSRIIILKNGGRSGRIHPSHIVMNLAPETDLDSYKELKKNNLVHEISEILITLEQSVRENLTIVSQNYGISKPYIEGTIKFRVGSKEVVCKSSVKCHRFDNFSINEGIKILQEKIIEKLDIKVSKDTDAYVKLCQGTIDIINARMHNIQVKLIDRLANSQTIFDNGSTIKNLRTCLDKLEGIEKELSK